MAVYEIRSVRLPLILGQLLKDRVPANGSVNRQITTILSGALKKELEAFVSKRRKQGRAFD